MYVWLAVGLNHPMSMWLSS